MSFSVGTPVGERFTIRPNPISAAGGTVRVDAFGNQLINLAIYDVSGRVVRNLNCSPASAGTQSVFWDARDDRGHLLASGIYFLRLTSSNGDEVTERVTVIR